MISPSFCSATVWVSFIFLERSFSASSLREASSAGPWLARLALCADKLQAGGKTGMSRPLRSTMAVAEMSEHQAGAGADHDRHAGDDREGGKQAAPDARISESRNP